MTSEATPGSTMLLGGVNAVLGACMVAGEQLLVGAPFFVGGVLIVIQGAYMQDKVMRQDDGGPEW